MPPVCPFLYIGPLSSLCQLLLYNTTGTYLDELAEDTTQPEVKTVEDFLDSIENQHLYQVLIKVDRLTLQIALMKIQGYSTREIAVYLDITEKAVYRRMDRLKEKLKKFFE